MGIIIVADQASVYVKIFKGTPYYDCRPLSRNQAVSLLIKNGFEISDVTLNAIPLVGKFEGGWVTKQITNLPKAFWKIFSFIMPTLIFICRKP